MSDPREIIHRGRRYVVRTSTVGGQVYYHVCPYSGHNPFAKDVMYIYNEGIAKQIMDLLHSAIFRQGKQAVPHRFSLLVGTAYLV